MLRAWSEPDLDSKNPPRLPRLAQQAGRPTKDGSPSAPCNHHESHHRVSTFSVASQSSNVARDCDAALPRTRTVSAIFQVSQALRPVTEYQLTWVFSSTV